MNVNLDVTTLVPKEKHPTIFRYFDNLNNGETLTIMNDHDPKPLYYQLLGERGNIFLWEYEEKGPEWWKVKITKNILLSEEITLGKIVADNWNTAHVLNKYGLDFCCKGKRTLKQSCQEKGIDINELQQELDSVAPSSGQTLPYNDWKLDFLADYIVNTHHHYVEKYMPEIRHYAQKVAKKHGPEHPELVTIQELVEALNSELSTHFEKEEKILFPYIKNIVQKNSSSECFNSVQQPISMMEEDHDAAGQILANIREVSKNYVLPEEACNSYQLLYKHLEALENDLHLHIHLENNILFPKAIALEKDIKNN
ncbi:MAG: iron-sulfur cluster repair di-iron protein [Chitinophagaceae bacterium]